MVLDYRGVVDSEEGLLLFGDAKILQYWTGLENEQVQGDRINRTLEAGQAGLSISLKNGSGVLWNIEGAGTTDIFSSDTAEDIILIRAWLEGSEGSESEMRIIREISSMPVASSRRFAELEIRSSFLGILASSESGACINNLTHTHFSLSLEEMMTENSGILLPCINGHYECFHDRVYLGSSEARRCHIKRVR